MDDGWIAGQPLPINGRTHITSSRSWGEAAVYERDYFERGLREVGYAEAEIDEALAIQEAVSRLVRNIDSEEADRLLGFSSFDGGAEVRRKRSAALAPLMDWLMRRELRVEGLTSVDVRVPLFVLAAPDVDGCNAWVEGSEREGRALSWNVTIFGSGLGGMSTLRTTATWRFTAAVGETKVIFVPVTIRVGHATLFERGQAVSDGPWVDASEIITATAPGLLLLGEDARIPLGEVVARFSLAGDTSGAIASYEYRYEQESQRSIDIGVKALGFESKVTTAVWIGESALALGYELRGGHDYELRRLADGEGLVWS